MIYFQLFLSFLKIGFLGFGGGYAMLALIFDESQTYGVSAAQFAILNALDLMVPGPIAINAATYVGFLVAGLIGASVSTIGVSVSSFVFVHAYLRYENRLLEDPVLSVFLETVKKVAVGLIAAVSFSLLFASLHINSPLNLEDLNITALITIVTAAVLRFRFKFNPILIIAISAALGGLLSFVIPA